MDLQLKEKRAFVSGASRGLGYAAAQAMAGEGCRLVINGRNSEKLTAAVENLASETGAEVHGKAGDVSDAAATRRIINESAELLGGLDILICNSGGPPAGSFESFDDAAWHQAVDLTFLSHVRMIREALPYLKKSQAASVLTVTSYSVKQPIPNLVLSNSIRLATIGLTKSLALELGREGIRFNSILPGWTETERVTELMTHRARQNGTTVEEEIARQSKESPLGRMGRPEEFGRAAAFLVSPAASYITGVMLTVDGGMYKGTM